jgi:O-antigen/teichoic acid export membrane protein
VQLLPERLRLALSLIRLTPFETDTPLGRSDERYRRILLTTISSGVYRAAGTLLGLVTVPLVLQHLGKERFGLWGTITAVVAWVSLSDFGVANGLVNVLSRAHGKDARDEAAQAVSTALAALSIIAIVLGLLVAVGAIVVPWSSVLAVRGAADDRTVRWSVVAALGIFVASIPLSVSAQIYAAYQKTYVANAFGIAGMLIGFVALLAVLRADAGLPAIIAVYGVGSLVSSTLGLAYALRRGMPWLRFRWSAVSFSAFRSLMTRSLPLFLFQIGALAVNETQPIVLAHRCDLATVAEYAIVIRLYALAMGLIYMATSSFVPSLREAHERGDHAWARRAFQHFVRIRVLLACCAGAALVLLGNPLLKLWLRRSDIAFPETVWAALAVLMIAATWVTVHSELLSIMDRLWILVALVFANGAVVVAGTWLLAPEYRVLGTVIATAAVTTLVYSWLLPLLARPLLREP